MEMVHHLDITGVSHVVNYDLTHELVGEKRDERLVAAQLAAARAGTHKTKTRGEVRGRGALWEESLLTVTLDLQSGPAYQTHNVIGEIRGGNAGA